jgi:hypothetical protein
MENSLTIDEVFKGLSSFEKALFVTSEEMYNSLYWCRSTEKCVLKMSVEGIVATTWDDVVTHLWLESMDSRLVNVTDELSFVLHVIPEATKEDKGTDANFKEEE